MAFLQMVFFCFVAALVLVLAEPPPKLFSAQHSESNIGKVFDAKQCGGPGTFVDWRIEGCDTVDQPCQLLAQGRPLRTEFDFSTSKFIEKLGLRIIGFPNGNEPVVLKDEVIPNSLVQPGVLETVELFSTIPQEWKSTAGSGQRIIYNYADNVTEVCAEATFEFV